jgi:hypothetical protein
VTNAALEDVSPRNAVHWNLFNKAARILLCFPLGTALALPAASVFAQDLSPLTPKISLQGDQKRPLTPEEQERQKRLDAEYKAATSKIPDQKRADPWADVRQAPSASASKKKQQ